MRLEIIEDDAGFLALRPWWDTLVEQSATRSPFMRWDWARLWWEEFGADYELALAVVREAPGAPPLAIAPFILGSEREGLRRHLSHLGFIAGLGEAKGERMDLLVPAGREAELAPLLCQAIKKLAGRWQAVRLNKVPEESPNLPHLQHALRECATGTGVVTRTECACIQLMPTQAEQDAQLPAKRKRDVRRRRELFLAEPGAKEVLATAGEAEERLTTFAKLHARHFPEGVSSFLAPRAWRFHERIGRLWLQEGRAMMACLEANGQMAGAIYGFVEGKEFMFYQVGWNPEYSRFGLGHLCIRWAVECCIQRGLKLFDMLPGSYRYKEDWAKTSRHVLDLEAYQPESLRAMLFRAVRSLKRGLPARHNPSP